MTPTAAPAARPALVAAALLFVLIVGTANSGGYRFGASDQAFYIPAVAMAAGTSAFPRDRAVFEPQMRLWLGDELLGTIVRAAGIELPTLFALLYAVTMLGLGLAAIALARALGCDWWTIALALVLLTLRHRIARTGANSLEGYFHPRMLAFACGIAALALTVRLRWLAAGLWTLLAALVHTSTAIWFAGVILVAAWWPHRQATTGQRVAIVAGAAGLAAALAAALWLPRMDALWLDVIGDRDYLFPADWPAYAWLTNLAYPVVLLLVHGQRRRIGVAAPGEAGLLAGLLALVVVFLVSVPLTELHAAFVVQLQVNRVFWLLDAVTVVYLAWWLMEGVAAGRPALRTAVLATLAAAAVARGAFVLNETDRPLARVDAAADPAWLDAMRWLRTQPAGWHVLADPGHAWKYGISIRAAAGHDTPLELGKDPAMAMYDRNLAGRVAEYRDRLASFDTWSSTEEIRALDRDLALDAFVDRADRHFDLPVLYRNQGFVVYDLR